MTRHLLKNQCLAHTSVEDLRINTRKQKKKQNQKHKETKNSSARRDKEEHIPLLTLP